MTWWYWCAPCSPEAPHVISAATAATAEWRCAVLAGCVTFVLHLVQQCGQAGGAASGGGRAAAAVAALCCTLLLGLAVAYLRGYTRVHVCVRAHAVCCCACAWWGCKCRGACFASAECSGAIISTAQYLARWPSRQQKTKRSISRLWDASGSNDSVPLVCTAALPLFSFPRRKRVWFIWYTCAAGTCARTCISCRCCHIGLKGLVSSGCPLTPPLCPERPEEVAGLMPVGWLGLLLGRRGSGGVAGGAAAASLGNRSCERGKGWQRMGKCLLFQELQEKKRVAAGGKASFGTRAVREQKGGSGRGGLLLLQELRGRKRVAAGKASFGTRAVREEGVAAGGGASLIPGAAREGKGGSRWKCFSEGTGVARVAGGKMSLRSSSCERGKGWQQVERLLFSQELQERKGWQRVESVRS